MLTHAPALVIFDKDGTLIDFQHMWGQWAHAFAIRLSQALGHDVYLQVATAYAFDASSGYIDPRGPLAIATMATMQQMAVLIVAPYCASQAAALQLVQHAWQPPDPTREAQPLADLVALFTAIRSHGVAIAIATADNRAPTVATMQHLGLASMIDAFACADDVGVAAKPAPDKIYAICRQLRIQPADCIMIGDTPADMQMGRNAGVMARIGVTSGLSTATDLHADASWIMPSVGHLFAYWPA
ncbi:MAG: HAD family hydrolase [Roseiflexaceae bacterium]